MRILGLISLAALSLTIFTSCVGDTCIEETEAFMFTTFYEGSTAKAPKKLSLSGIGVTAEPLYDKETSVKSAKIPLNPSTNSCSYTMIINDSTETITINYNPELEIISQACGYSYFFDIQSVSSTNSIIDSIIVQNNKVTNTNAENIRIYY